MNIDQRAARGGVVITGTSSGIGEACALHLDKLGFRVFATVRKETDADALRQQASDDLTPIIMDVTDAASIASAVEPISDAVGEAGLAGLINSAGICVSGPFEVVLIENVREQFEVNVIGLVAVTQACIPLLRKGKGRIINMGSVHRRKAVPFHSAYSASHWAVEALSSALRFELLPWGIPVINIEADAVATRLREKSEAAEDEMMKSLSQKSRELYEGVLAFRNEMGEKAWQSAVGADSVAEVVAEALTSETPKNRYAVGSDSGAMALLTQLFPDEVDSG
jgi:NAD(P)-dependent dehydrogenase (short-subunit alcohol dehydrogenase family)